MPSALRRDAHIHCCNNTPFFYASATACNPQPLVPVSKNKADLRQTCRCCDHDRTKLSGFNNCSCRTAELRQRSFLYVSPEGALYPFQPFTESLGPNPILSAVDWQRIIQVHGNFGFCSLTHMLPNMKPEWYQIQFSTIQTRHVGIKQRRRTTSFDSFCPCNDHVSLASAILLPASLQQPK